jgi:hypothetical protein
MSLIFSFNRPFQHLLRDILVTSGSRAGLLDLLHIHGTENDNFVNGGGAEGGGGRRVQYH